MKKLYTTLFLTFALFVSIPGFSTIHNMYVNEDNFTFTQSELILKAKDTIQWNRLNKTIGVGHTLMMSEEGNSSFHDYLSFTPDLPAVQNSFANPGIFHVTCYPHGTMQVKIIVEASITGTIDLSEEVGFNVFPSPAKENITVQAGGEEINNLKIFNVEGEEVAVGSVFSGNRLNVANLSTGIYTVVFAVKGEEKRIRFIKE